MGRNAQACCGQVQPGAQPFKKGGVVKHSDAKQDKAMIKKAVKAECLTGKKCGGAVKK
jgi:hypothetical protein